MKAIFQALVTLWTLSLVLAPPSWAQLVAAVLPSSRSVQVGVPATAFATIINAGQGTATGCSLSPLTSVPATFAYQTTNPATNQVTGTPNTPVDIPAGAAQSFVFALTPTAPFAAADVQLNFVCTNTSPAPVISGLNTLLLSASATPVADIVALAATPTNDGIVEISGMTGTGVFAVATVNVGAGGEITATPNTGSVSLPVTLSICQTDPATSACLAPPAPSVTTQISANATPTFGIFVTATSDILFDPASARIFVDFTGSPQKHGRTSVAAKKGQPTVANEPIFKVGARCPAPGVNIPATGPSVTTTVVVDAPVPPGQIEFWVVKECPICGEFTDSVGVSYKVTVTPEQGTLLRSQTPGAVEVTVEITMVDKFGQVILCPVVTDAGSGISLPDNQPLRFVHVGFSEWVVTGRKGMDNLGSDTVLP